MPEIVAAELVYPAIYLLVGCIAGIMAGLLGVGGGLVIVPALVWVFSGKGLDAGIHVHLAVGTSLATIVLTSLSSIRAHHRRAAINWPLVKQLTPGILIGAWIGAVVADLLPTLWLQRTFACFAILVSFQMVLGARVEAHRGLPGPLGISTAGGVIGMISAVVGIGGGSMTVPFLNWCGIHIRQAVATSAACGLPIAIAGAMGFVVMGWGDPALPAWSSGYIYWPAFLGIVSSSFLFAPLGALLAHNLPVPLLKRIFALLLLSVGIKMLSG